MKRKFNIFLHNIRVIFRNKKLRYKIRFVSFAFICLFLLFTSIFALFKSFAYYNSRNDLVLDIQTAMYVIEEGEMTFNIDLDKIVPSNDDYVYAFSISNFNDTEASDVDLEYKVRLETTTNMPLTYKLYFGSYSIEGDDIISSRNIVQDVDNSWYNILEVDEKRTFYYNELQTDNYYLVINFPISYKNNLEYSHSLENIQVIIESRQII